MNKFFTVLIRNNTTQETKQFITKYCTDIESAATLATQLANQDGWTNATVLEVAERLMTSRPSQIDS